MAGFADLARLATEPEPQYPGIGPDALAGLRKGRMDQEAAGYRQQAASLAQLQAQAEAMKAEEAAMGRTGRIADIERKNLEATDALDFAKSGAGAAQKRADILSKLSKAQRAEVEAKSHIFAALAEAPDEESMQALLQYYGDEANISGKQPFTKMKPQQVRHIAKGIMQGLTMTPKQAGAERIQDKKNEGAANVAQIGADSREKISARMAEVQQVVAQIRANTDKFKAQVSANKLNPNQYLTEVLNGLVKDGLPMSEAIEELNKVGLVQLVKDISPAQIGPAAQGAEKVKLLDTVMGGLKKTPQTPTKDKFEVNKVYKDAGGNKAKYLGNGKWEPIK